MARIRVIRGSNLPDTATKTDCHNLVDDATAQIYDIVNSEVKSDAAIVDTKLDTIRTTGKFNLSALVVASQAAGDILYVNNSDQLVRLPIGTAGQKLRVTNVSMDYFEYSSDATAQATYVTSASETIDQQNTSAGTDTAIGDVDGVEYLRGQGFTLSEMLNITAVEVKCLSAKVGSPSGNWTLRIETDSNGKPSGTLANTNASIVVTPPGTGDVVKGTFATPFDLSADKYWLVVYCDSQSTNNYWNMDSSATSQYSGGSMAYAANGVWTVVSDRDLYFKVYVKKSLQAYSESTIKVQGAYALKAIALITTSLNNTLTRTVNPTINLTGINTLKFDIRSSRTGSNIKIGIHDSGGTTSETTPNITSANAWQTVTWDISGVSNANKDAIDSIIVTVVNADATTTFYLDNFFIYGSGNILAWVTP